MVLAGDADELRSRFLDRGDGDAAAAWPAVRALIASGRAELVEALAHAADQRALTLEGARRHRLLVAERSGLPLRLLSSGASAGLNLRLDRFRYEQGGVGFGPGTRRSASSTS